MVREVPDNPKYLVTSTGVVINKSTGRPLKPQVWRGYQRVYLMYDGTDKVRRIHRLVAQAFIPNPLGYDEVNHINFNKADNRVENLEWCDRKYNVVHSLKGGRWPKTRVRIPKTI